jgi:hypothetical protein
VLFQFPRQVCITIVIPAGRSAIAALTARAYMSGNASGSSPRARQLSRNLGSHRNEKLVSSI